MEFGCFLRNIYTHASIYITHRQITIASRRFLPLTAAGDTVNITDLDIEGQWWSTDPNVFNVEEVGWLPDKIPARPYVLYRLILAGAQKFTGRDSAFVLIF